MSVSSAVDASAVARVVGIKTNYRNLRGGRVTFLPQRVAVIGQGATASTFSTTKRQVTSALEVGQLYGFGSPLHLAAQQLLPVSGDGVGTIPVTVYPLEDAGTAVAASGDITPTGTATAAASFKVRIGGVLSPAFNVAVGDAAADVVDSIVTAINSNVDMPVIAADGTTEVTLTAKWKGESGNSIQTEIVPLSDTVTGVTFAVGAMANGATNPDVDTALDQIGDVWETLIVNCMEITDDTTLDKIQAKGEGRWGSTLGKPFIAFTGRTSASTSSAIAVPEARKTDRVNAQLVAPGSPDLPLRVAARQVARIAVLAQNDPAYDYGGRAVSGIEPGTDAENWGHVSRDVVVKGGSSTVELRNGALVMSDTVTMYHPDGDPAPAYRYVVDVVKLMNVIFNLNLIFQGEGWNGAPLIPDNQPTTNRSAKQPKMAVAAVAAMLDNLGLLAIISDPETAKANTMAEIDASNPKRLNLSTTIQLSGNTNIISVDLDFGFYFGGV